MKIEGKYKTVQVFDIFAMDITFAGNGNETVTTLWLYSTVFLKPNQLKQAKVLFFSRHTVTSLSYQPSS